MKVTMMKRYWSTFKTGTITKFLILSLLFPATLMADAVVGGAYLASGHIKFPCKQALRHAKAAPAVFHATMWQTFGISNMSAGNRCWRKIIKKSKDKPHVLEFYLSNEVCRRKGNCFPQELNYNLSVGDYNKKLCDGHRRTLKAVKARMTEIKDFCGKYGNEKTTCLLAIGLESQFSECATRKLVETAKGVGWGESQIVHNPVDVAPYMQLGGAYYFEQHGTGLHFPSGLPASRRIITLDGIDPDYSHDKEGRECLSNRISENDLQKWTDTNKGGAAYLGHWSGCHQGIEGNTATSPDPRKRTPYVAASDVSKFIAHARYDSSAPPPEIPGGYNTKRCTKVMDGKDGPGGFLWKESEHGGLVVLFPGTYKVQFKEVVVLKPSGAREKLSWSGWGNPDPSGERQHYRNSKDPKQFPDKSVIRAVFQTSIFSAKQFHCWKIEDASERND